MSIFSFSGTGERTQITSGSGGISNSDTSVEVDAIPSDLSAGDTVKIALGGASTWQGGSGETVYGEIGTIGGGANGGTEITGLSRGQEGTTAASWLEGDAVRLGVSGPAEAFSTQVDGIPALDTTALNGFYFRIPRNWSQSTGNYDRAVFTPLPVKGAMTVTEVAINIKTAGNAPGIIDVRVFGSSANGFPAPSTEVGVVASDSWNADTTGIKAKSCAIDLSGGLYWVGLDHSGWGSAPEFRTSGSGKFLDIAPTIDEQFFKSRGPGIRTNFKDSLDSFTASAFSSGNEAPVFRIQN